MSTKIADISHIADKQDGGYVYRDSLFSAYKTFPEVMNNFVSTYPKEKQEQAEVLFYNGHYKFMRKMSKAGVLRMPFYVFTAKEAQAIKDHAKGMVESIEDIDAFAERLFLSKLSKYDIDTYFNLYFAPMDGLWNTEQGINAFKFAGVSMGAPSSDVGDVADFVDAMELEDYATFWAIVVSKIKVLNPQGYADGINRFIDKLNGILFNPENFISADLERDSYMANEQMIIEALKLPKDNLVFRAEYIKNMDLMLYTRMIIINDMEIIPAEQPRLDFTQAIETWRHNARVRLGDVTGELQQYRSYPKEDDAWYKDPIKAIVAIVAIALIAPYAIAAVKTAAAWTAAKTSALYTAAVSKVGELGLIGTAEALKETEARIDNLLLDNDKREVEQDIQTTVESVPPPRTTTPPKESDLTIPLAIGVIALAAFL
jgi:hypothetical protein